MRDSAVLNWKNYLIEAWSIAMFMVSASLFVIIFEHPAFYIKNFLLNDTIRRMCIGAAMGVTAILLIYSDLGKHSGAHMNPAVTIANYLLNRISLKDAFGYIFFQAIGACIAMLALKFFFNDYLSHKSVNYIVTQPGKTGIAVAAISEFCMSFIMFLVVMIISNSRLQKYAGYFAGVLVFIFISIEAPLSGMSINPARSLGSAVASNSWTSFWLYVFAPVAGMLLSGYLFQFWYFLRKGECKTMHCLMNGQHASNKAYHVYSWFQKNENGNAVKVYAHKSKRGSI